MSTELCQVIASLRRIESLTLLKGVNKCLSTLANLLTDLGEIRHNIQSNPVIAT